MSKKQDFLRDQQSRDKHPESGMTGSQADLDRRAGHQAPAAPAASATNPDAQEPGTGKLANDHNKAGETRPTQTNQPRRTPQSRHDRQVISGGPNNIVQARTGGKGAGRGPRGAG